MAPTADVRARAMSVTIGELAGRTQVEVMAAGRETIQQTSKRWRRVTDGNPCGFCAVLASRVYESARGAGEGRTYHKRCGCTAEPVAEGRAPTPPEDRFTRAYGEIYRPGMSDAEAARLMEERLAEDDLT